MDYVKLRNELLNDPAGLGYSGLNDEAATAKINATDTGRTINRTTVTPSDVLACVDDAAWPATAILQHKLQVMLAMPTIDASNANIRGIFGAIFPNAGATANTRTRLLALATEAVSRAHELGFGEVTAGDVQRARTGGW